MKIKEDDDPFDVAVQLGKIYCLKKESVERVARIIEEYMKIFAKKKQMTLDHVDSQQDINASESEREFNN